MRLISWCFYCRRIYCRRIYCRSIRGGLWTSGLGISGICFGICFGCSILSGAIFGDRLLKLGARHDVDVPASQLTGEADVLALAANRQRLLVFANDHERLFDIVIERDVADFGRFQRVGDQRHWFAVPANDVDAFAVEFVDDRLDSVTAHANTGANTVDLVIARVDCQLGAVTWFALDAANRDRAVRDFRDFEFEQRADEVAVGAAQDDLDAWPDLLDLEHHRADAFADVVVFAADLLGARQDAFEVATEVDDDRVAFEALDIAADDLAELGLVFGVDDVALSFAHLGDDGLLDRHREDAALIFHRDFVVADELSSLAIESDVDIVDAVFLRKRVRHRILDAFDQRFLVDFLVASDGVEAAEDFTVVGHYSAWVDACW